MSLTGFKSHPPKPLNASARLLYEEALARGVECTLFDDKQTILMQKGGVQWYTRGSRTSLQSSVGRSIANNKVLTKAVLDHFQLPCAKYVVIRSEDDLAEVESLSYPVVIKPVSGAHGHGVQVGLTNLTEVAQAYSNLKGKAIVEEMLVGREYRVVCVDYTFVAAAYRKPAFVTGDGEHTLRELIDLKNEHPWRARGHSGILTKLKVDAIVEKYLEEQGYTLDSIPKQGIDVYLRKTANLSTGGEAWEVTDEVSEENKVLFEKIARVCDLNTLGIDVMCADLTQPIRDQKDAGVIEVNASPGLRMHHFPMKGEPIAVAKRIMDMVFAEYGLEE